MDLYTLTDTFLPKDVIDQYVSAIWTERYSSAGDTQLVVPPTPEMIEKLKEGTFLALRGSDEVMELKTQSIEEGLMTVVGQTLVKFLDERYVWFKNAASESVDDRIADYTDDTRKPGEFISDVVYKMAINTTDMTGDWATANLDWSMDEIPYLTLGAVDTSETAKRLTATTGPLYTAIQQVAEKEGVGISLYLESADPITGYSLKFKTYRGVDHTTGSAYDLVRLLPDMDSLSGVKEIRSIDGYKNICYVFYKGVIYPYLADPDLPEPEGFARRVLITNPDSEPVGHKETFHSSGGEIYSTGIVVSPGELDAFLDQNAKDALANHNYIRAVDGQTSPTNDYQYGVHYSLGDLIELESFTGIISKARVTEYIRSHDNTGEKAYPTISVVASNEGG